MEVVQTEVSKLVLGTLHHVKSSESEYEAPDVMNGAGKFPCSLSHSWEPVYTDCGKPIFVIE